MTPNNLQGLKTRIEMTPPITFLFLFPLLSLPFLADEQADSVSKEPAITAEQRTHWSFRPLQRPVVPDVKNTRWP